MSGFGSLYYTDCVPGQGLQGVAGFQFQAASPGAEAAMALVQRSVLYEPPASWMRDRRPVDDYPRSLAHTADGGFFATAAGRYLGKEANGPREGNQFTHAVVTRDAAAYGLVRPAQLWDADWWATGPALTTRLEPLPDEPAPGPLDVENVRDRVEATPGGQERLTALLSAIQHRADPQRRRTVVLVATDPADAALWIAAATLLLPGPQALRTSFKIFAADAQYGGHDVIALHPDWAGRWADAGPGSGLAVFHLDRGRHSEVEPTAAASFWVPRFLTGDVYDVVDAVELSGQFARSRPGAGDTAEPTDADRLAAVVVAGKEALTTPREIDMMAGWLLDAPPEAGDIAGEDVLEAVLAAQPRADVLRTLAEATGARGWVRHTLRIQRGLLPVEVGEVLAEPNAISALRVVSGWKTLRVLDRPAEDDELARTDIEQAIRLAEPRHVPALFAVAQRYGLRPHPNNIRAALAAFAAWWLTQPAPELELGRWPAPPEAVDCVRDTLRDWLQTRPADALDAIGSRWWRPLFPDVANPHDLLDAAVLHAAYDGSDDAQRQQVLRDVHRLVSAGEPHPGAASSLAWDVLFGHRVPTTAEAERFVEDWAGPGRMVSDDVLRRIVQVVDREALPSAAGMRLIGLLRQLRVDLPPRLVDLSARDDGVVWVIDALRATPPARGGVDELADALNAADLPMLDSRAGDIVAALIAAPPEVGVRTLRACSRRTARPLYDELRSRWPRPDRPHSREEIRAAVFGFVLFTSRPLDRDQEAHFAQLLRLLADVVGPADTKVRRAIGRQIPTAFAQRWAEWLVEIEPRKLRRALNFVAKAVPGKSEQPAEKAGDLSGGGQERPTSRKRGG